MIGTGSECFNNLFNSLYVINGESDCGFVVVVDAVAVADSLRRKLTLETPAFDSLYEGQFTLATQLIKPNYVVAVVSLLDRVLSSLHVVDFFQVKLLGVQSVNALIHSVHNFEILHPSEYISL